jgi:hypothetical protein
VAKDVADFEVERNHEKRGKSLDTHGAPTAFAFFMRALRPMIDKPPRRNAFNMQARGAANTSLRRHATGRTSSPLARPCLLLVDPRITAMRLQPYQMNI